MGISWSSGRRNNRRYHQYPPPPSHQLLPPTPYYYPSEPQPYLPPAPPPRTSLPPPTPPPPPVPPPNYAVASHLPYAVSSYTPQPPVHSNYYYPGWSNACNYANPYMAGPNYHYYPPNQGGGWPQVRPQPPPLPPVEHQNAKKVKNAVNVRKDTIRLEMDEEFPDHHLISFVFDALFDGRMTIYYFAKEEDFNCKFDPIYPDTFTPIEVPFQKGVGQKFHQPSGTGIDLGFFELDHLAKPSPEEDVFPLVISAESVVIHDQATGESTSSGGSPRLQITQAVLEQKNGQFQVKVVRQLLWIDGVRYELRDLYGIGTSSSSAQGFMDDEPGKECVICMTEPKDTAILPCRHLCMCSDCAKELTQQSNKCPICRQPIESLMGISTNNVNE